METATIGGLTDVQLEESTLGAIVMAPSILAKVLEEAHLKPEHFFSDKNKRVYETILSLHNDGTAPSEQLVSSYLNGSVPENYVLLLASACPSPGSAPAYAKRLVELFYWRLRHRSAEYQLDAIQHKDLEKFSSARALLDQDVMHESSHYDPDRLEKDFNNFLDRDDPVAFALPFPELNDKLGGGFRRGQVTMLGGWSSHGKSVLTDQFLEGFAEQGYKCHLYMNEMTHEDRVIRTISRNTGIPFQKIAQKKLTADETVLVRSKARSIPYSITPCAGWSIEELAFDIRNRRYDVIAVDIIHQFDYDSENELAKISRLLNRTAKQTGCHVLGTVHLNEARVKDVQRPRPITRDIRGSGMLKNDADNVMFVYREQDPYTGDPLKQSSVYLSKVRNGMLGSVSTVFNPTYMKFDLPDHDAEDVF